MLEALKIWEILSQIVSKTHQIVALKHRKTNVLRSRIRFETVLKRKNHPKHHKMHPKIRTPCSQFVVNPICFSQRNFMTDSFWFTLKDRAHFLTQASAEFWIRLKMMVLMSEAQKHDFWWFWAKGKNQISQLFQMWSDFFIKKNRSGSGDDLDL